MHAIPRLLRHLPTSCAVSFVAPSLSDRVSSPPLFFHCITQSAKASTRLVSKFPLTRVSHRSSHSHNHLLISPLTDIHPRHPLSTSLPPKTALPLLQNPLKLKSHFSLLNYAKLVSPHTHHLALLSHRSAHLHASPLRP